MKSIIALAALCFTALSAPSFAFAGPCETRINFVNTTHQTIVEPLIADAIAKRGYIATNDAGAPYQLNVQVTSGSNEYTSIAVILNLVSLNSDIAQTFSGESNVRVWEMLDEEKAARNTTTRAAKNAFKAFAKQAQTCVINE